MHFHQYPLDDFRLTISLLVQVYVTEVTLNELSAEWHRFPRARCLAFVRKRRTANVVLRIFASVGWRAALLLPPFIAGCSEGESGIVLGDRITHPLPEASAPSPKPDNNERSPIGAGGANSQAPVPLTWQESTCKPSVSFENLDTSETGTRAASYLPAPSQAIVEAAPLVCELLYQSADEVPRVPTLQLVFESMETPALIEGTTIRISTTHLTTIEDEGNDASEEVIGLLYFFLSHAYLEPAEQTPSWLVSGLADYVRLKAGFIDPETQAAGGAATDGFRTTAFFLSWLNDSRAHFVLDLNARLASNQAPYSDAIFTDLTTQSLDELWAEYQLDLQ